MSLAARGRIRFVVALGAVLVCAVLLSSWNVFFAMGSNNRLERRCPAGNQTWVYDRSSWTPLRWSCDVVTFDGEARTIAAFEWFR